MAASVARDAGNLTSKSPVKATGLAPIQKNTKSSKPTSKKQTGQAAGNVGSTRKVLPQIRSMRDRFEDMIRGRLDNLPLKPPSEVRVFLSSTFSDMRAERNSLAKVAYPHLKDYCYNNLDLDFQVVDLRWGITDGALNDHSTGKLCLMEIENCQNVSLGPNFVAILGDRYGGCPLPTEIPVDEFTIIQREADLLKLADRDKLALWYKKDENNIPPIYVLQPINSIITLFGQASADNAVTALAKKDWYAEKDRLQAILHQAVNSAHKKGLVTDQAKHTYFKSVTEQEIDKGLLATQNPGAHALCFFRKLTGLTQDRLADKDATRFTEAKSKDGVDIIDNQILDLRTELHSKKLPSKLPQSKTMTYHVPWEAGGISIENHDRHREYIDKFCNDFMFGLIKTIEEGKHERETQIPASEYYTGLDELLHHLHFCNTKCETFKGRQETLNSIQVYLKNPNNRAPLTVYADSGLGKTSVMAKVMQMSPDWFGSESIYVIRFLGTSTESTELYNVLFSVAGQLADECGMILEPVGYKNTQSLIKYFPRLLRNVSRFISKTSGKHAVIILDSIDQLGPADNAYSMKWLPIDLPANVHIVLSMLPQTHDCLTNTRKLVKVTNAFLQLEPLPQETGREIIDAYLEKHQRRVQDADFLLKMLADEPRPLFLKLILDKAVTWQSYAEVQHHHKISTFNNVQGAISDLFAELERKYGSTIICRALGYLTIGLNGLTEVELEDILSLDDDFLNEVYVYHNPPVDGVVRVPSLLWKRIHYDLREYIVERSSQGKKTMYWYHRQFIECAKRTYCGDETVRDLHANIAKMYMCENGAKNTIRLTRRKITIEDADRQITHQPMTARNKRMLQSLPYHLRETKNLDLMKKHALCNLKFIMTKIKAYSLSVLLKDYVEPEGCTEFRDDLEIVLIKKCLEGMKSSLNFKNIPIELVGRLSADDPGMPYITELVSSCWDHLRTCGEPSLLPLYPCLGGLSQLPLSLPGCPKLHGISPDHKRLIVECTDTGEWKLIDCSTSSVHSLLTEGIKFPPSLSANGQRAWLVKEMKGTNSARCIAAELDIDRSNQLVQFELPVMGDIATKTITAVHVDDKNMCIAFDHLEVQMFVHRADKSLAGELMANHEKTYQLNTNKRDELTIRCIKMHEDTSGVKRIICTLNHVEEERLENVESYISIDTICGQTVNNVMLPIPGCILTEMSRFSGTRSTFMVLSKDTPADGMSAIVVDVKAGCILHEVKLSDVPSQCMFFHGVGSTIAVPEYQANNVRVYNIEENQAESVDVPENINTLCTFVETDYILLGDSEGKIHLIKDNKYIGCTFVTADVPVLKVFYSKDADCIITVDAQQLQVYNAADIVKKISNADGQPTNNNKPNNVPRLDHHRLSVAADFSGNTNQLITLDRDCRIRTWSLENRKLQKVISVEHGQSIQNAQISVDSEGQHVCALLPKNNTIYLIHISSEEIVLKKEGVVAFCIGPKEMYLLLKTGSKFSIDVISLPNGELRTTIPIKESITGHTFKMKLSDEGRFLVLGVACAAKELDIILKTEKKNHMSISSGNIKLYSIELDGQEGKLGICYRQLSKIPCLGVSWEMMKQNHVAIGRDRTVVIWNMVSGSCDQKMIKGTKVAMVYRPEWIEHEADYQKICHGRTESMMESAQGDTLAVGSEDGFVMAYSKSKGDSFVPDMGKKPNHGGQVKLVSVSSDGKWIASYCNNQQLKTWDVFNKMKEVSCIGLGVDVSQILFSPNNKYVVVRGTNSNAEHIIFVFEMLSSVQ